MSTSPNLGQADASGLPTASSEFGSWQQYAILVIDDEGGMRNFLGRALSSRCGAVKTAASA